MTDIYYVLPPEVLIIAFGVTVLAGFVKGAVGFAMPMIMISTLTMFLPADTALAALIVPTMVTNVVQSLRQGLRPAIGSIIKFRLFLLIGLVFIVASAQLYAFVPSRGIYLLIGVPIFLFSVMLLSGFQLHIRPGNRRQAEIGIGAFAGLVGGVSGVWGPPTVAFLTAINTEKTEQMRVQGVIYGLGSVALFLAHLRSGVLNAGTLPLSVFMCVPALIGLGLGFVVQGRLNAAKFRRVTLFVLLIASLNLVRRAVMG